MAEAVCGNFGQVFGVNVWYNREAGSVTHQGSRCVQTPRSDVGPVRRRLEISPTKHTEGTSGVGVDQEIATEEEGGSSSLGKVLSCGRSGGDIVWGGDMGDFGANNTEVRGIACGFPALGHKVKGKSAEGWVVAAGGGKNSPPGSGDTAAPDLCGQYTGDSGGVGGPTADF